MTENKNANKAKTDIFHFTHKGNDRSSCKDVFSSYQLKNCDIICLSDGVSSMEQSDIGALAVQREVAEMMESLECLSLYASEKIRFRIACTIKETMYKLSKENRIPQESFASTLMLVILPKGADFFWTVHLGDGIICSLNEENEVEILSYPQNGITRQYTYTTVSSDLYFRVRIKKHTNKQFVFSMTDGVSEVLFSNDFTLKKEYEALISNQKWDELEEKLCSQSISDDIGFTALQVDQFKTIDH